MAGIIIFAMIAVFLGLRLYAVLGRRTGHEQSFAPVVDEMKQAKQVPVEEQQSAADSQNNIIQDAQVVAGLKAITSADHSFDTGRFIEGAKSAYKNILEAFWKGDEAELATLASEEVRMSFGEAISARKMAGHVLDNRLVSIETMQIIKANVANKVASITMQFVADIAAITRNAEGAVIAGSLTDAVPTIDVWTFSRATRSDSAEWTLTDTDESA